MKRSEINVFLQEAEQFFSKFGFKLPDFARRDPKDWDFAGRDREIYECNLGWDVTDFGSSDFLHIGLLLFTLRNGVYGNLAYPKPYAEKLMISLPGQKTPMHYHIKKTEDIINRGGGDIIFRLYRSTPENGLSSEAIKVARDGEMLTLNPGAIVRLKPGESLTLTPGLFHEFYADSEGVPSLIGEVSSVNDDHTDNVFYEKLPRFPDINEDEPPKYLLVTDYQRGNFKSNFH